MPKLAGKRENEMPKPTKHERKGNKVKRKSLRWAATFHGEYAIYRGRYGIAEAFTIHGYGVVRLRHAPIKCSVSPASHIHWFDKAELLLSTETEAVLSRMKGEPPLPEVFVSTTSPLIPMLKHLGKLPPMLGKLAEATPEATG